MTNAILKTLFSSLVVALALLPAKAYGLSYNGIYYKVYDPAKSTVEVTYDKDGGTKYAGDIVIPESFDYEGRHFTVTRIGQYAFINCKELTSLKFPETLTSIGNGAVHGCELLKEIVIPESVTEIEASAFSSCKSIKTMTLPPNVTSISDWLFDGCSSLETVNLPKNIKSIGEGAFKFCYALKSIEIGDQVTVIPSNAFWDCNSLESVEIPDGVISIEDRCFGHCTSLKEVKIGSKVKEIGSYAFSKCPALEKFVCMTITPPYCSSSEGSSVFADSNIEKATLVVPTGSATTYASAAQWNKFGKIEEAMPMPSILSIDNVVRHDVDDTKFKLTCTVKCQNADKLYVDVEEEFNTTVRTYSYDNPTVVEVETGNITSVYNSTVTFRAVNETGETQEILEFTSAETSMPDGLYYAGSDGKLYCLDNDGNTTVFDTEEVPHTFQLLHVGDRIYGASAGTKFTFNSQVQTGGDGKLFYLSKHKNGESSINVVLDNEGGNHNRDPYGLAAYKNDIYVFDRSETIRKISYNDQNVPQDYPSWLENSWIGFYGHGWAYGCIKSDLQITEASDAQGKVEPVYWLTVNYGANGLFRFKEEAIDRSGFGNSSYNKIFFSGLRSTSFCFDEANDHLYIFRETKNREGSGLFRLKISDMANATGDDFFSRSSVEIIDCSPVRIEGTEEEHVGVPQLSIDSNGEYLYWCYRAPTSEDDYDSYFWNERFDESNPMHHTGIKRIKLGEATPKVEMVAEGVDGYGIIALNYKGQNSVSNILPDAATDDSVEYYNLQGIRITNPLPGSLVIRRQGNHVSKIRF